MRTVFFLLLPAIALACSSGSTSSTGTGGATSASSSSGSSSSGASSSTGSSSSSGASSSSTSSSSGGNPPDASCTAYGSYLAACLPDCAFADPKTAAGEVAAACEAGYVGITDADRKALEACIDCFVQAAGPMCAVQFGDINKAPQCKAPCAAMGVQTAGPTWQKASFAAGDPMLACTDGQKVFVTHECAQGGGQGTCGSQCCNGKCGPTPDVAVACTGNGPIDCKCTSGKNTGKTFQLASCNALGDLPIWTECNL